MTSHVDNILVAFPRRPARMVNIKNIIYTATRKLKHILDEPCIEAYDNVNEQHVDLQNACKSAN